MCMPSILPRTCIIADWFTDFKMKALPSAAACKLTQGPVTVCTVPRQLLAVLHVAVGHMTGAVHSCNEGHAAG